jgi:hypothetical protein
MGKSELLKEKGAFFKKGYGWALAESPAEVQALRDPLDYNGWIKFLGPNAEVAMETLAGIEEEED